MARAHFVAKAQKDHPGGIKKGDPYWWWKFMQGGRGGPKQYSKTRPRRSQLTQSAFFASQYDLEDRLSDLATTSGADLAGERDSIVEDIRALGEEQQEKLDNLPESLKEAPSGQTLQSRVDGCEEWASELEGVDCDNLDEKDEGETDEAYEERVAAVAQDLAACSYNGE